MTILDMAKAHLQNISQRCEELTKQKQLIQNEIENLSWYIQEGFQKINDFENKTDVNSSSKSK